MDYLTAFLMPEIMLNLYGEKRLSLMVAMLTVMDGKKLFILMEQRNIRFIGTKKSPQIDKICGLSYNKPVRLTLNGRRLPSKVRFGV